MGASTICQRGVSCFEQVTKDRDCPKHPRSTAKTRLKALDERRGSAADRGYDKKWFRRAHAHKVANPYCLHHELGLALHPDKSGDRDPRRIEAGKVADHVRPWRGDRALFDADENLQTLCKPCDDAKRARENGLTPCAMHGERVKAVLGVVACIACGSAA